MAAVSANVIHHQQQSGHPKVTNDDQSDEESNDGSNHSMPQEKRNAASSPEYKPTTSGDGGIIDSYCQKTSDTKYVCSTNQIRSPNRCGDSPEIKSNLSQFSSTFSMQNVLKMKSERDSVSPTPVSSSSGVFSTEKLLENTPNYTKANSSCNQRNDESVFDESPKRINEEEMDYRENEYNLRSSSPGDDDNKSNRLDISGSTLDEGNSCCSEDTVLSVGNEAQVSGFDIDNRTCSTVNSTAMSPRSSPTPSPASSIPGNLQSLSSFKHIQSHLSAISQLSQNLHGGQHMLLRPSPVTANPLMFLNQNRLLFNSHLPIQPNVMPIDVMRRSPQSLSNSPTSVNPAMSGLSPNDLSPTASLNSHQLSPSPPVLEGKMSLPQNVPAYASLPAQLGQSLRFYKQNAFPPTGLMPVSSNLQNKKMGAEEKMSGKKLNVKSLDPDKINLLGSNHQLYSLNGLNERFFSNNNVLSNNPNITHNNHEIEDNRHNIIINHNGLKFSIDNILKADFGRRITDPLHKRSKSGSSKHKFGAAVLNPLNSAGNMSNLSKQALQHSDLKESFGSSAFKKSAFHSSKDSESFFNQSKSCNISNSLIPNTNLNSSSSSSGSSRLSSERLSTETRIPSSSDLKSVSSLQNNIVSSSVSVAGSAEKPSGAATSPINLSKQDQDSSSKGDGSMVWPAWVYCTRYSDRPSSGPRTRRPKKQPGEAAIARDEEKRPRTAFSGPQLARLKHEFAENRYLTERRRQQLSGELGLNEAQIKIWFQNKRAKIKKASGQKNPLALQLMAQGLYNHSTVPLTKEEEELQELHARESRETKA